MICCGYVLVLNKNVCCGYFLDIINKPDQNRINAFYAPVTSEGSMVTLRGYLTECHTTHEAAVVQLKFTNS